MLNGYHILTLTHRHAALEQIGKVIVPGESPEVTAAALGSLKEKFGWEELLYLSTCNRVLYFFYAPQAPAESFRQEFVKTLRVDLDEEQATTLASNLKMMHGGNALRHLLEVASSMDSLVVGEREILRQLREAYERCANWGLTGDHIRLAMDQTVKTAKEVYSKTGIGEKQISVVSLAFAQMMKSQPSTDARILLVGAGQTNELFSKFLIKKGFRNVTVFNRTLEKAQKVAHALKGKALPLAELPHFTEGFDIMVVCTGAQQAVITPELYQQLLMGERSQKTVVDLSVPNNVAREAVTENAVRYIEIEGLRDLAQENMAFRESERQKAETIINHRLQEYRNLWHERQVERSLQHIPAEVRAVKNKALNEVFGKEFEAMDANAQALILEMMDYMEKKCIAIPIKAAKAIALEHAKHHAMAH